MGDLVTAFPLPPGYYLLAQGEEEEVERAVDRIQKMKPPPPPGEDLTCFGVVLKERDKPVQVIERMIGEGADPSFVMPTSLEERVALLRELKNSLLLNFIQLTRLILSNGKDESQQRQAMMMCVEDLGKCQRHAMYVLAELRRQQGLLELKEELSRLLVSGSIP